MNRTNSCYTYYIRSSILSLSLLYTLGTSLTVVLVLSCVVTQTLHAA